MVIWPRRINSVGFHVVALDVLHYRYTVDDLGVTPPSNGPKEISI